MTNKLTGTVFDFLLQLSFFWSKIESVYAPVAPSLAPGLRYLSVSAKSDGRNFVAELKCIYDHYLKCIFILKTYWKQVQFTETEAF